MVSFRAFAGSRRAKFLVSASLVFAMIGGAQVSAGDEIMPPVVDQQPPPPVSPEPPDPAPVESLAPETVEQLPVPQVEPSSASVEQQQIAPAKAPLPSPPPVVPPVQAPVSIPLGLSIVGHRMTDCDGWNEVIQGRPYAITAGINAPGIVRLNFVRHGTGETIPIAPHEVALSGGQAQWIFAGPEVGDYWLRADYLGNGSILPVASPLLPVRIVGYNASSLGDGVRLNVPWFRQQFALTCESASLRSALAFHGVDTGGDWPIMQRLGVDDRQRFRGLWGNPEVHFVGSPNGRMVRTGYGVHATPIARVATTFRPCRTAVELGSATDAEIAAAINDGFPVQVWGAQRGGRAARPVIWRSFDGLPILAWDSEHTWLVVGYRGPALNPSHFIVHDSSRSARGAPNREFTVAQFHAFTKYFSTPTTSRVVVIR